MGKALRLLIAGFGSVGQALGQQLDERCDELRERIGGVSVVGVADRRTSVTNPKGLDIEELVATKQRSEMVGKPGTPDALALIGEIDADIYVELASAGGQDGEPGLSRIRRALGRGMHVVSANKMPLAVSYSSLMEEAKRRSLQLRYGACVGGGVPVIELGEACAASETITRIDGVLNATSNYILTKMEQEKQSFEEALGEAQAAGYAETDPSLDIDGVDAACKIVILGNHVLRSNFALKDVKELAGIRGVTAAQVEAARASGKRIRMVATAERYPRVGVTDLDETDPLVVNGASHSVRFRTSHGDKFVGGVGAGGPSTSAAVLRDIIHVARAARGES